MKRLGLAVCVVLMGFFAASAQAAFPGRNGLLAVEPLKGSGVVLIKPDGRGERHLCQGRAVCAIPLFVGPAPKRVVLPLRNPHWSRDGRALVASAATGPLSEDEVIYPDGSCLLTCPSVYVGGPYPAFTNDPTLFTAVLPGQLVEFGIDGIAKQQFDLARVSDPMWSSRGELAVVQGGVIWVGSPQSLRRLTRGRAPSWSPDGKQIVFERKGWLMTIRVSGHRARRLVRGNAPAWSPDGRWIAFFNERHRLSVVRARGGRAEPVGEVTGTAVDWQPLPIKPRGGCLAPPGSTIAASGDAATVTFDSSSSPSILGGFGWAAMGCLRADGRQHVLATNGPKGFSFNPNPTEAAVGGHYAALVSTTQCGRYGESEWSAEVTVYDVRTGAKVSDRGGEYANGGTYASNADFPTCHSSMDQLVLGGDAVSAVHTTLIDKGCTCTVEQIQASDRHGVQTLDSVTEPDGSPTALTNLTLTGDTLTWNNNGSPRSAQLEP